MSTAPPTTTPAQAASSLRTARTTQRTLDPFTDDEPHLDEDWGYATQDVDRRRRLEEGEVLIGAKLGLTSAAKQRRMNLDRPIVGFLTDTMRRDVAALGADLGGWAQPRIEPEIAFITARDLSEPLTRAEAITVVESVTIAAEILDSRYTGYRFALPDVVADNTSAAGLLLGSDLWALTEVPELAGIGCRVEVNGEVVHRATGAAILGDPLQALVLLAEHLTRRHETLPAGSIVLAGALTDAVPLDTGSRYRLEIDRLGTIEMAP